ncbi:uncharacterized protein AB675_3322 [Cyphellophora attinorum]|uniref:Uncharacterized protein n=1 Tax=Cyphellophora attinorum TaxID=1664694 RepID=A0A0N1HPN4_9EURO|nr:uncharacterized protein AB675_3322 [Phialophora attinorum]KPI39727.1 hypothetical protein AB675_3322 [Phialophora attinorum]
MDSFTSAQPSKAGKIINNKRKASPESTVAEGRPTKVAKLDELSNDSTSKPAPVTKRTIKDTGKSANKIATNGVSQSANRKRNEVPTINKVNVTPPSKKRKRILDIKKDAEPQVSAPKRLKQTSAADQSGKKHSNQENVNPKTGSVRGRESQTPVPSKPSKPLGSSARRTGSNQISSKSDVQKKIEERDAAREREVKTKTNAAILEALRAEANKKARIAKKQRLADAKEREEQEERAEARRQRWADIEGVLKACGVTDEREFNKLIKWIESTCSTYHFGDFLDFHKLQQKRFIKKFKLSHPNRGLDVWLVPFKTVRQWEASGTYVEECIKRRDRYLKGEPPVDGPAAIESWVTESETAEPETTEPETTEPETTEPETTEPKTTKSETAEPARKRKRDSDDEETTTDEPKSNKSKAGTAGESGSESAGTESGWETLARLQKAKRKTLPELFAFHGIPALATVKNERSNYGMVLFAYDKDDANLSPRGIGDEMKAYVWRKLEMALGCEVGCLEGRNDILNNLVTTATEVSDTVTEADVANALAVRKLKQAISYRYGWGDLEGQADEYFWDRFNDLEYVIPPEILKHLS